MPDPGYRYNARAYSYVDSQGRPPLMPRVVEYIRSEQGRPSSIIPLLVDAGYDPLEVRVAILNLVESGRLHWTWSMRLEEDGDA